MAGATVPKEDLPVAAAPESKKMSLNSMNLEEDEWVGTCR
jgi:hypothetical protein